MKIDQYGNIRGFNLKMINAFDGYKIPEIIKDLCKQKLDKKLKSIYQIDGYRLEKYIVYNEIMILTPDKRFQ